MKQSRFFAKTLRQAPKDAEAVSHKLLTKAGFIDQCTAGVYSFLPLGLRVLQKIENIIRENMNAIGAQEVFLPSIQPKNLWLETDRWDKIDPPLFKFKDQHKRELCLGPTHEEVIADLVRTRIQSYKDLPFALYQIQNKFRNEIRATAGLLRVREFLMKDLYSFHATEKCLDKYYDKVVKTYKKIFAICDLKAKLTKADSGTIGGKESHEFLVGDIEAGHIFKLCKEYSEKMQANFTDKNGQEKPIIMGCYGIGLGRLMATIVETHHDKKGIIWPKSVAPFDIHLIALTNADKIYKKLKTKFDVLYDDRDESPGVKFTDADLIGIPIRIVVSEKTLKQNSVEIKNRNSQKTKLVKIKDLTKI